MVLPGMLFVVWAFPECRHSRIWLISFVIAILGLVGVIGFDWFRYFSDRGRLDHGFMRAIFAVIMSTNLPLVGLATGSIVNWMISRRNPKLG